MKLDDVLRQIAQAFIHGTDDTKALDTVMDDLANAYAANYLPSFAVIRRFVTIYQDEAVTHAYDTEFDELVKEVWGDDQ